MVKDYTLKLTKGNKMVTYEDIREFWADAGKKELDDNGLKPTARDPYLQELIEKSIMKYLNSYDNVLDIGCGEGSSTKFFASKVKKIVGIDYTESLIEQAKKNNVANNATYLHENVLTLETIEDDFFDVSINIRCLINLPEEEMQFKGIENIFKKIKSGGLCIFNEGTINEFENLNVYRTRNKLTPMVLAKYNKLFPNAKLEEFFQEHGYIIDVITLGDYIYGSRIVHPMIVGENNIKHDSEINYSYAKMMLNEKLDKHPELSYSSIYIVKKK